MIKTGIMKGYQSIDDIMSKIGQSLPINFDIVERRITKAGLQKYIEEARAAFVYHKPPIVFQDHIGTGGFAHVFTAWSSYEGVNDFAVKILRSDLLKPRKGPGHTLDIEQMRIKDFKKRFTNESYVQWHLSKNLSEPVAKGVVHVYDHGEFHTKYGYHFILMERMGDTLRSLLNECRVAENSRKNLIFKTALLTKIASIIQNVHAEGVFHRDIKPENILFKIGFEPEKFDPDTCYERDGVPDIGVKLGDFGTVRWIKSYTEKYDGIIIGSQYYMSPEQVFAPKTLDQRTDIYSFGVVAYELLFGSHPKVKKAVTKSNLVTLAKRKPTYRTPPEGFDKLGEIIYKCMSDLADRYQTMDMVVDDLREVLAEVG